MTVSKAEFEKLKKWYKEEILRRDKIIDQLKDENKILVQSSIKTSKRLAEMQETKDKMEEMAKLKIKK